MEDEEATNELKTNNSSNTILGLPCKEQHLLDTLSSSTLSNSAIFLCSYASYYSTTHGNYHLITCNLRAF
jgi:hypothetical protein